MTESVSFLAPMTGRLMPLTEVPDQVFAQGMVGQGFAIEPSEGRLVAPAAGRVLQVFPGGHAVVMGGLYGLEVILHIGLDTVELAGQGFRQLCHGGQEVKAGDVLIEFDIEKIRDNGRSPISPCVIANSEVIAGLRLAPGGAVRAGEDGVMIVTLK